MFVVIIFTFLQVRQGYIEPCSEKKVTINHDYPVDRIAKVLVIVESVNPLVPSAEIVHKRIVKVSLLLVLLAIGVLIHHRRVLQA